MSSSQSIRPRREFLRQSVILGAAAGAGTWTAARGASSIQPIPASDRPKVFTTGAGRARKIAVGPDDRIFVAADKSVLVFDAKGRRLHAIPLPRPARCLTASNDGRLLVGLIDRMLVFEDSRKESATWVGFPKTSILSGIAVGENDVFVVDAGEKVVWRLDAQGQIAGKLEGKNGFPGPAEFQTIETNAEGELLIANPARHRIESYKTTGELLRAFGKRARDLAGFAGCCNPVSFATLEDGRFVTAERGRPRIKVFGANGNFQKQIAGPEQFPENAKAAAKDNASGCIRGGFDLAVDSLGAALVLDRTTGKVHRFVV